MATETNAPATPPAEVSPSVVRTATGDACPNCLAPLHGPYCYACGQPKKGLIRHLSGIIGDFFDTVFSLDARIWRTLAPLYFRPGYLSNEYFAGRRVRYVTPLRLYFFLSIIAFLVISLVANFGDVSGPDGKGFVRTGPSAPLTAAEREAELAKIEESLKFLPAEAAQKIREEAAADLARESASVAARERADAVEDAEDEDEDEDEDDVNITFDDGKRWHKTENPLTLGWLSDDLNRALNEEIEVLLEKIKRINKDPAPFVRELFSIAPQALFLILPLFALLLKLFYLFKRRLYMEHMIVALHSHSFLCFSLLVLVALAGLETLVSGIAVLEPLVDFTIIAAGIWIPLYLLVMQRRVYRQNWFMTVLKYILVGICYAVLLSFGLVAAMLASLIFMN